jgi:hypothetical protein
MKMQKASWIFVGLGFVALGIAVLAAPSHWEGPILVPISPGHGLSLLDMFGVAPILVGMGWLYVGLWQRRHRIFESIQKSPKLGGSGVFVAGLGLGLLLASSFSAFFWWYVIGAFLFSAMLILALKVAA